MYCAANQMFVLLTSQYISYKILHPQNEALRVIFCDILENNNRLQHMFPYKYLINKFFKNLLQTRQRGFTAGVQKFR
jgi:hypothetical protein